MQTKTTVIKTLPRAWNVAGQKVKEIEFREPTVKDLVEAERDSNPTFQPHAYRAALAAQTLVRAGSFTGPFAPAQFHGMSLPNWNVVIAGLAEAEALGEDELPGQAAKT
jgi:hypothetical protein